MQTVSEVLRQRSYPGRGCLVACCARDQLNAVYFVTGRSAASQARTIEVLGDGDIQVRPTDGESNDPLRHYAAAVHRGRWTVVGNGNQVTPIAEALADGRSLIQAASDHTFEPDSPIFTSRIWIAHEQGTVPTHFGYIAQSGRGAGPPNRVIWSIDDLQEGEGVLVTTYDGTPENVKKSNQPVDVSIETSTPLDLATAVWQALLPEVRVAAFVVDLERFDRPASVFTESHD